MKLIVDSVSIEEKRDLIAKFEKIYEAGFPDENEREEFDTLLKRTSGDKPKNEPHTLILLDTIKTEDNEIVIGGLIADWYERSKALHLIYIIVDENHRKKKTATRLIRDGIPLMKKWIQSNKNIAIKNVFFESNNPIKTTCDNFDPVTRLEIFGRLGAKVFNLPYIQPALDGEKESVDNLLLLSFTPFNEREENIAANDLILFLEDLYESLGRNKNDEDLIQMKYAIDTSKEDNGNIIPDELVESHLYKFPTSSVTLHYVKNDSYQANHQPENQKEEIEYCRYFGSYETDLLNYQNQNTPPFATRFIHYEQNAELIAPTCYCYTSEGISHTVIADRRKISIDFSVSHTTISKSGCQIFHISLRPSHGSFFSDLDLVKLATHFGSKQERVKLSDDETFMIKIGNNPPVAIAELLNTYSKNEGGYQQLGSGIVQIDLNQFEAEEEVDFKKFFELHLAKKKSSIPKEVEHFSKVLCGIILGIFDFERMDDEEIFDTILPIVPNNQSFIVMSRGMLLKISNNSSFMESIGANLIVSPYLLIPNVALLYNEYLLNKALDLLDKSENSSIKIKNLEKKQTELQSIVNIDFFQDLFQYPSEKDIIQMGNLQRGIDNLYEHIVKRIGVISEKIICKKSDRSILSEALLDAVLGIIATAQIVNLYRWFTEAESTETMIAVTVLLFVALVVFYLSLKRNKR